MDGAYIPDRFIAENKNSKENVYALKEICTPNRESMIPSISLLKNIKITLTVF